MAKIKAVKFHSDYCQDGKIKYPAGTLLPENEELLRCVALNFAEVVSIDEKKVDAINGIQDEIAILETDLAVIPEADAEAKATLQSLIDARRAELAELQPVV
jgi:hypothetical protein